MNEEGENRSRIKEKQKTLLIYEERKKNKWKKWNKNIPTSFEISNAKGRKEETKTKLKIITVTATDAKDGIKKAPTPLFKRKRKSKI